MSTGVHLTESEIQEEVLDLSGDQGWTVVPRKEMNELRGPRRMNEAAVEPLLVDAICKINKGVDEETAREVAARVRRIGSDREMQAALRDGIPLKPAPDKPTRDVKIVDDLKPSNNSFIVTEEFSIRTGGQREPRLDVVYLVNGIPLGAIENKAPGEPLSDAADDWRGYWSDAPQLAAYLCVVGCCNGMDMVVGPSGLDELDDYSEWTDPWPQEAEDPDDHMANALAGPFNAETLLDLSANFVVFETRDGVTTKKLARSQQFRAANKIVDRVVAGELDRGIIWHAPGSGKSLTMIFAARKLLRVRLGGPTVLLVIDRTELDEQINETLTACEFDGVDHAMTRRHLEQLLASAKTGGVIVTTVHKFDERMVGKLKSRKTIAFIDEAHRSQFGTFAISMRKALPKAFLFGFTGTPIETDSRSTRRAFSPVLDGDAYENYLDRYGFDESVRDGATVPLVYEPRLPKWRIESSDLEAELARISPGLSDEERDKLRDQAVSKKVVAKAPQRVAAVAADIADQIRSRVAPRGLKAQAVMCDREGCALLAEELSKHLEADEFAVIMSRSKKDSARRDGDVDLRKWYASAQWKRVHGHQAQPDDEVETSEDEFVSASDRAAIKDLIGRFKRDDDPLNLLIVNSMLITGFDAPIEGALFLDRELKSHTLMQTISRPNRRYRDKDAGLVFDYWGLLVNLEAALDKFASEDLEGLLESSDKLADRFPVVLSEIRSITSGAPESSARRQGIWLFRRFANSPEERKHFEDLVHEAQSIFDVLAPDPRLADHLEDYKAVLGLWGAWLQRLHRDRGEAANTELRHKSRQLVQDAVGFQRIQDELPPATIDADFLKKLAEEDADELTPEEKAADIEAAVIHEIKVRGEDDPLAKTLAERLDSLRRKQDKEMKAAQQSLEEWQELVQAHIDELESAEDLGLGEAGAIALATFRRAGSVDDAVLVDIAREVDADFKVAAGFPGWSERSDVVQGLRRGAVKALAARPETRALAASPEVLDELVAGLTTLEPESA